VILGAHPGTADGHTLEADARPTDTLEADNHVAYNHAVHNPVARNHAAHNPVARNHAAHNHVGHNHVGHNHVAHNHVAGNHAAHTQAPQTHKTDTSATYPRTSNDNHHKIHRLQPFLNRILNNLPKRPLKQSIHSIFSQKLKTYLIEPPTLMLIP